MGGEHGVFAPGLSHGVQGGPGVFRPILGHGVQRGVRGASPPGLDHRAWLAPPPPWFRPQSLELTHKTIGSVMFFVVFL